MQTELTELKHRIQTHKQHLDYRVGEARAIARRAKSLEGQISELSDQIMDFGKAIALLNTLSEERQESAQRHIESLVTTGLHTIFDRTLSFHIVQSVWGDKRTEVTFIVRSTLPDGKVVDTSPGSRGGGYRAVIGVLLRIVILLLTHKDKKIPLILDESFAHLSAAHRTSMAEFLSQMSDKTGIQILMVTHHFEFSKFADKIYDFKISNGATEVKEISYADVD